MKSERKIAKDIYKTYKRRCEEIKTPPISFREFRREVYKIARINLSKISSTWESERNPFLCTKIDDIFLYYMEQRKNNVVVNIWSRDEFSILTKGRKDIEYDLE